MLLTVNVAICFRMFIRFAVYSVDVIRFIFVQWSSFRFNSFLHFLFVIINFGVMYAWLFFVF